MQRGAFSSGGTAGKARTRRRRPTRSSHAVAGTGAEGNCHPFDWVWRAVTEAAGLGICGGDTQRIADLYSVDGLCAVIAARRRVTAVRELRLLRICNVAQAHDEKSFRKLADELFETATEGTE